MKSRRASRIAVIAIAIMVLGLPTMLGGAGAVTVAAEASAAGQQVEEAAARISQLGEEQGVLGVYWDAAKGEVVVVTPADGPAPATTEATAFRVRTSVVARGDVAAVKTEVKKWVADGVLPRADWEIYFDPVSAKIVIEGPDQALVQDILGAFPGKITFIEISSSATLAGRLDDSEPFFGGGSIATAPGCSLGFAVLSSGGTPRMLTAGHCFALNATVKTPTGRVIGTIGGRQQPVATQPSHDTEWISGKRYGGRIWTGTSANDASVKFVNGASDASVGFSYCYSGSYTFNHCGVVADAVGVSKFFAGDGVWVDDLVRTYPHVIGPGDSGGPFYRDAGGGNASARGTIVGQSPSTDKDYAQMWGYIAGRWNVTICTVFDC